MLKESCYGISISWFFIFLHQLSLKTIIRYEFLESFWAQKIDAFIYFYFFSKSKFEVNIKRFSDNSDWPMTFFTSFYESSFITIPFLDFVFHFIYYLKSHSSFTNVFFHLEQTCFKCYVSSKKPSMSMGFQFLSCFLWSFFVLFLIINVWGQYLE